MRYSGIVARGWESKSVESQIEERDESRKAKKLQLTPEQIEIERKRDALQLQRTRVLREIEAASSDRHRKTLEQGLKFLDDELAKLG